MKVKGSHKIQIPNPCSENWDAMSVVEKGRFCANCKTVVTDFSQMSDKQLIEYLAQYKESKICGHVRIDQLNRALVDGKVNQNKWLKWTLGASLSFGLSNVAFSQSDSLKVVQSIPDKKSDSLITNNYIITGRVVDTTGTAVVGTTIKYTLLQDSNFEKTTYTDEKGNFTIHLPDSLKGKSYSITHSNFEEFGEVKIEYSENGNLEMVRKNHSTVVDGGLVVTVQVTPLHRAKSRVRRVWRNIFN